MVWPTDYNDYSDLYSYGYGGYGGGYGLAGRWPGGYGASWSSPAWRGSWAGVGWF
ncbi:hypothetical protein BGW42_000829 [Actinomortierella wolfii]|nr:hypothetical protein BGW42_000829 [Actinomortierella wolfii]